MNINNYAKVITFMANNFLQIENMEALQILLDKIRALSEENEALDEAIANHSNPDNDDVDMAARGDTEESASLRKAIKATSKEIQILKKSVPEGDFKVWK